MLYRVWNTSSAMLGYAKDNAGKINQIGPTLSKLGREWNIILYSCRNTLYIDYTVKNLFYYKD
jgi:hypothetical protein